MYPENMQQICRRAFMPMCDFNKAVEPDLLLVLCMRFNPVLNWNCALELFFFLFPLNEFRPHWFTQGT